MKFKYIFIILFITSCKTNVEYTKDIPEWSKNSVMYEVNIRQFSPEGTFNAFSEHLPRIKEMGVDIIWLMPIHSIGEENRKGTLGSYYSVKDYKSINSEFGTKDDFRNLVNKIHELDMKIIIDWVANHSSFDNIWVKNGNLDWYNLDSLGKLQPPSGTDWWDVADLNFDNIEMKQEMIESMKYWVQEFHIDGFRCDVADWVPISFWDTCRMELDRIKDVFMLAEAETPELHDKAFDMTYAWEFHFIMNDVANSKKDVTDIIRYIDSTKQKFDFEDYRLQFISNHDENSWKGYAKERLGDAVKTFSVLSVVMEGMPLLYNGQEANLQKRLEFFEKDTISWDDTSLYDFYKQLFHFKKENEALWNGNYGGPIEILSDREDTKGLAFLREKNENKVLSLFNLSSDTINLKINSENITDHYTRLFTKDKENLENIYEVTMLPWEFRIFTNNK